MKKKKKRKEKREEPYIEEGGEGHMGKLKQLKMTGLGRKYLSPTKITHLFSSQPNNPIIPNFPYFFLSIFHPLTNNPNDTHLPYVWFKGREQKRRENE